ncbi:hypothetical protein IU459_35775 [Nocardia amamiensis]|uniref:Integrase n=1 Tax=Nocardia amamiensis TaxID=404578 RepID=A0ABS0D2H6_9NOCA|nr:hypothetical protein [Nocardia amamiensis]MBF6302846.1 hypothetical protein [Nocardia amamiensis]
MTSLWASYTVAAGWVIAADEPFVRPDRLPERTRGQQVSRFGDPIWNLDPLSSHNHSATWTLNWELFPERLRETGRRAGWALVNLATPEEVLEGSGSINRVKWISAASMVRVVRGWRRLAQWTLDHGMSSMADLTTDDLEDFAVDISRAVGRDRETVAEQLHSVSLLWGFAPHLPPSDHLVMPPWEASGTKDDYLPPREAANENSTVPIHPAVMSPLLVWAIRFVDDFSDDILAAWDERQALVARVRSHANPEATAGLRQLIADHTATGRPLPGCIYLGRRIVARTYLAGLSDASTSQVKVAVRRNGSSLPISTETPLETRVQGRLHEQPWLRHVNFHDTPILMRRLSAACMIVILYLSGMRPGEALELQVGCCPEPDDTDTAHRYAIHGNYFKHARDADDRAVVGGLPRETPWTVIPPVVRAIRVLVSTFTFFPARSFT